jgi:glycerol-3-phosphate dehydrogenase
MRRIETEILVIGGGATGTGIARDLAMRGFKTILVERADLTHGTTGRYHGLLHSGGRYVVKDPLAAKECIEENHILRKIMPQCIEDTGGFFVVTPWDDLEYVPRFVEGCNKAGIPVEEISIQQMLRDEPLLNPNITRCFRVPDASADSFLGADLNAESARQHGAQILTYHKVIQLLCSGDGAKDKTPRRITGALCTDLVNDEQIAIQADLVVNASGAWAGKIASTANIPLTIIGGKGVMVAMNHRIVNTVINRCKMPSDGDILVPAHTVSVIGTTDVKITDPDRVSIEPWEIHLCLEEGDKLVPGFKEMRMLRAWAGVRPLYQESAVKDTRDVTRAFVLLDHERRDGVSGIVTITSGKWTTYRKMAEVTVDLVCQKLGTQRACRTHLEPLSVSSQDQHYHYLGSRLKQIEKDHAYGQLVCECELATYDEVAQAIVHGNAKTLDDVRRDVRLGKGPCQGGFCTYRVTGILHRLASSRTQDQKPDIENTNVALRDFLQERWKGILSILWGQQLRQERLDELIYLDVLNADHLPGPLSSRLGPEMYDLPTDMKRVTTPALTRDSTPLQPSAPVPISPIPDVLVIGGGLAGLVCAWQASQNGKKVRLVTKGWGTLHWGSGCVDVMGYASYQDTRPLQSPLEAIQHLSLTQPDHPYALVGLESIQTAVEAFKSLCNQAGYPLLGDLNKNWLLPTALGTIRPTCLAPETMIAGDLNLTHPILVVGFSQFPDFYPELIADNLSHQGIPARGLTIEVPSLRDQKFVTGRVLASLFENPEFQREVASLIQHKLSDAARIGLPAVLGLNHPMLIKANLEKELGVPVFEIPTLPPSIPGIRLHQILVNAIESARGRVYDGMQANTASSDGKTVRTVYTEAAARSKPHTARTFVLATGGILGGGYRAEYEGMVREVIFNLLVDAPTDRTQWFRNQFLSEQTHPIYRSGISTDKDLRPIDQGGNLLYDNLYVAGSALGHCDPIHERSVEGIALATGFSIGNQILK